MITNRVLDLSLSKNLSFTNHTSTLKKLSFNQSPNFLPTHSTSVTLYILAILIIYVVIFVALVISNFLTDYDNFEENQEQLKKYYSAGLKGKKSNRLRSLFISNYKDNLNKNSFYDKTKKKLTFWKNKFVYLDVINKKQFKNKQNDEFLDNLNLQTECLL